LIMGIQLLNPGHQCLLMSYLFYSPPVVQDNPPAFQPQQYNSMLAP